MRSTIRIWNYSSDAVGIDGMDIASVSFCHSWSVSYPHPSENIDIISEKMPLIIAHTSQSTATTARMATPAIRSPSKNAHIIFSFYSYDAKIRYPTGIANDRFVRIELTSEVAKRTKRFLAETELKATFTVSAEGLKGHTGSDGRKTRRHSFAAIADVTGRANVQAGETAWRNWRCWVSRAPDAASCGFHI